MERRLKERLIGASVLVMLAVILIPMILDDSSRTETRITQTNIPARPDEGFTSRIVPLPEARRGESRGPDRAPDAGAPMAAVPGTGTPAAQAPAAAQPLASVQTPAPATAPATAPAPAAASTTAAAQTPATRKPEPAPKVPAASTANPEAAAAISADRVGVSAWIVQLGSFSSAENANALAQRLRAAGYAAFVEPVGEGGDRSFRVRVGPELLKSDAQALGDRLKSNMHLDGIVLSYP